MLAVQPHEVRTGHAPHALQPVLPADRRTARRSQSVASAGDRCHAGQSPIAARTSGSHYARLVDLHACSKVRPRVGVEPNHHHDQIDAPPARRAPLSKRSEERCRPLRAVDPARRLDSAPRSAATCSSRAAGIQPRPGCVPGLRGLEGARSLPRARDRNRGQALVRRSSVWPLTCRQLHRPRARGREGECVSGRRAFRAERVRAGSR